MDTTRFTVDAGVVTYAANAELRSRLGVGFPAWPGGVLSFVDTVGMPAFAAGCDRLADSHGPHFAAPDWLRAKALRGETLKPVPARAA